jgi:subtilisin family serine protease
VTLKTGVLSVVVILLSSATAIAGNGAIVRHSSHAAQSYIALLADSRTDPHSIAADVRDRHGVQISHVFETVLRGFSFIGPEAAARAISADPHITIVEEDGLNAGGAVTVQTPVPSWGLDRIDQSALPLDNSFSYEYTGSGTVIYVIDSGVNFADDIWSRIRQRVNLHAEPDGTVDPLKVDDCVSYNGNLVGHGTQVATIAAGRTLGVARRASIVSVRVLGCDNFGSDADVIAGMD